MKLTLAKKGIGFIPATDDDKAKFIKIAQGETVEANYSKNRNTLFHRKFFALLNIGFDNQDKYKSFELYRARVMIGIGHCDVIFLENGNTNFIPKSISYDALPDNNDFEELYNKAVEFIAGQLYITDSELAEEVLSGF